MLVFYAKQERGYLGTQEAGGGNRVIDRIITSFTAGTGSRFAAFVAFETPGAKIHTHGTYPADEQIRMFSNEFNTAHRKYLFCLGIPFVVVLFGFL